MGRGEVYPQMGVQNISHATLFVPKVGRDPGRLQRLANI